MALRRGNRGFTLVELLVVISIIGMLAALLMPAVQAAREAGRRNTCMNNIRQVGIACSNFSESRRHFPGYLNTIATGPSTSSAKPYGDNARTVGYLVMILPFMERNDLYQNWSNNSIATGPDTDANTHDLLSSGSNNFSQPYLEMLVCPSDPATSRETPVLSYVANAGSYTGISSSHDKKDRAEDGVFFNHAKEVGSPVKVTMDYLSSNDGSSNTLMLAENLQADCWTLRDNSGTTNITVAESPMDTPMIDAKEFESALYNQAFVWFSPSSLAADPPPQNTKINDGLEGSSVGNFYDTARPSSRHPGGANVIFCDGHHRFITEEVDYDMFRQLMTPKGKAALCTLDTSKGGNNHQLPTLDDSKF